MLNVRYLINLSLFLSLLIVFSFSLCSISYADSGVAPESVVNVDEKPDKYNRRTPRGAVEGFLSALAEDDFVKATAYFNLNFIPDPNREKSGIEIAKKFQYLLDHAGKLHANALISAHKEGVANDDLDINQENIGVIYIDDKEVPVILEQVEDQNDSQIWLFSAATLKAVPAVTKSKSDIFNIVDYVPNLFVDNKILSVALGYWLIMILAAMFSFFIAKLFIDFLIMLTKYSLSKYITEKVSNMITALHIPARMWFSVYIFILSLQFFSVPIIMRQYFNSLALAVYLIACLILVWQLTNIIHFVSVEKFKKVNNAGLISIIDFTKRCVRFILVAVGLLLGLHLYDHNVTTGLAALGIGGLAIALGAQKTLENIAGSINVVADQSVNIGDYCIVAGVSGTIEEVGIRSTKIRTRSRTLVTIPNAEFSSHIVENCTKRDKYWLNQKIGVRYETSPDQLRYILVKLQSLLYAHSKVENESLLVKLAEFGPDSLIIEIFAYIKSTIYYEYMGIKQDIMLRIIDIIDESGTGFAFPSQTLYLSKDKGLSSEKTSNSEQFIKDWILGGNVQLPEMSEEEINKIVDTIPYPPPYTPTNQ